MAEARWLLFRRFYLRDQSLHASRDLFLDIVAPTMRWLSVLPYPWCRPEDAASAIPAHADLADIVAYLKQAGPIPATP